MNAKDIKAPPETLDEFAQQYGKKPVTWGGLMKLLEETDAVIIKELRALRVRAAALEAEVETLKARPLQKWAGVFVEGTSYAEASLVTKSGSLWVATTTTTSIPGAANGDWRLIVKRGQA
jgi:hypothetical protein